jgi:uncharacterized protein YndB with AHSA1/START domain
VSVNETHVDAPPEAVFDVLADPYSYGHWVPGSSRTRHADASWPAPGAAFGHTQGFYGLGLKDTTEVVASERPRTLVLEARFRPFAINRVELRLSPSGAGTRVVMVEYPTGGPAAWLHNPLMDLAFKLRNVEALRRLRKLAEQRDPSEAAAA